MLPLGLALALSSVPIMTTIFILLSPNRVRSALPFLIGWVIGIAAVVTAFALLAKAIPSTQSVHEPDVVVGVIEIALGVASIVLATLSWRRYRKHRTTEAAATPKWLSSTRMLGPAASFGLAFVLNLRPKGILLAMTAGLIIHADSGSIPLAATAIVVYTVIAASTVAVPIIATLVAPAKMEPPLVATRAWLLRNGTAMTCAILGVIGVVIVGMGIARF